MGDEGQKRSRRWNICEDLEGAAKVLYSPTFSKKLKRPSPSMMNSRAAYGVPTGQKDLIDSLNRVSSID